ncbi:hypothetical protein HFP15_15660 [Amycolatopsis sp. K13G38]|uniref:Uncharacterized protein n=1 Tax=Amycolatopsis acididurans TaxID=2724524 RepID=A0ABX1J7Q0_9PSEU|nr:hypothetical protein [Amycolatopsis acididurans]NKQ54322.1 hypothetical protein [Amycolatopsis acididurans]
MLTLGYPQSAAARWGWLADAGHAGTALLAGSLSSRWRRVALSDAAIAATWAGIAALPPQAGRFRPSRR